MRIDRSPPVIFVKDSAITSLIKTKFAEQFPAGETQLKVGTDNSGAVWLSGIAASQAEANKAVSIARAIEGVSSVRSTVVIRIA